MEMIQGLKLQYNFTEDKKDIDSIQMARCLIDNENILNELYKFIGCNMVDCVKFNDRIDIWCDDEALLKNGIAGVAIIGEKQLVGNLIFIGHDGEGNCASLSEGEFNEVIEEIGNSKVGYNFL